MTNINLSELVAEGQHIETKVANHPTWVASEIIMADNQNIHVRLNDEYLKLILTVGDSFCIKLQNGSNEYTLNGFVENIVFVNPPKVIIRVEEVLVHENDRKTSRYSINYLCRILPSTEEFKIQGVTTDISENGISMISYADFNLSGEVEVEVIVPQVDVLKFKGSIRRLTSNFNDHIQYGIEIIEIDEINKSILQKIIALLENK